MLETTNSQLEKLSVHLIGEQSQFIQSEASISLESAHLKELLKTYFTKSFTDLQTWTFTHQTDLKFNEVYQFARTIFDQAEAFHEASGNILRHLVNSSRHHAIKPGELFVALVSQIQFNNQPVRGLVLIKSELKTEFLQVHNEKKTFKLDSQLGLDLRKIDKGCLILDTADGLDVLIIDQGNRGSEAQYWKDAFLGIRLLLNDQYKTENYLSMAKEFITKEAEQSVQIERPDQVDMLNRSVKYFKRNEHFNEEEFVNEVFGDPNMVKAFKTFKGKFNEEHDQEMAGDFEISAAVVKKQARIFKSVIKLDKNFHLYIHGNRDLIEQGYDERVGKKFYKIYFDQEL